MKKNSSTEAILRTENATAANPARDHSKPMQPFSIRELSVLAYANGFTLWHYTSATDTLETTSVANYMADVADMLSVGDIIMATGSDGCRMICVTKAAGETVITAPLS